MEKLNTLYFRKSSIANQEEMVKFQRQVNELTELVENLNEPFEVFNDEEAKSRNDEREEWVRLKDWINEGKVKSVYCIDDSRLTRNDEEALAFYSMLKKKKVKLISLLHGEIDLLDRQSAMVAKIKAIFNAFEYDNTVTKIEEGKFRSIKAGVFNGKLPLGYSRGKDKRLVPNEDSRIVIKIFNLYKNGYTTRVIADMMNEELNVTTYHSTRISRILRNDTYLGRIGYYSTFLEEGVTNDNAHDPLVDIETFRKVQEMLKHRNKLSDGQTVYEREREGKSIGAFNNPLHRLVYCRECGNRRSTSTSNQRSEIYYSKCKHCGDSGLNSNILWNHLLQDVSNVILELKELSMTMNKEEQFLGVNEHRLEEVSDRLTEALEERSNIIRMTIKKHITEAESDSMMVELNGEIEELEKEKKELIEVTSGKTIEDRYLDIQETIRKLEVVRSQSTTVEEVNRLLRGLCEGVYFKRVTELKIPSVYVVWNI